MFSYADLLLWSSGFLAGIGAALIIARLLPQRLRIEIWHLQRHPTDDPADDWKRGGDGS